METAEVEQTKANILIDKEWLSPTEDFRPRKGTAGAISDYLSTVRFQASRYDRINLPILKAGSARDEADNKVVILVLWDYKQPLKFPEELPERYLSFIQKYYDMKKMFVFYGGQKGHAWALTPLLSPRHSETEQQRQRLQGE